jgi:two-component system, OmpR family, sensor histidine kinase SenX3
MRRERVGREDLERSVAAITSQLQAARSQHELVAEALKGLVDAVVVADASGHVIFRNEAAERFRDGRHAEAVAEATVERLLANALAGELVQEELALFGPPRAVLDVRAVPLAGSHGVVGAAVFVRDVTELRRVENVRRDFVANVSHELKTPLGALALLAETIAEGDDPGAMRALSGRLVRETERLARLVDDLLELSLVEAQDAPARQRVAVRALVEDALDRVRAVADARAIDLEVSEIPAELAVECDAQQVVSAIANLVDNAVKYSDSGTAVQLRAEHDDGRIVIEVRDHGIGIPARDLERIFERFYRVDQARSRATGGTGLGLSIVRHVAQSHGGDVTVESLEGEGSVFRLALALGPEPAGAPS